MKPRKIIGILGGAGPLATASFFSNIINIAQLKYKAEQDTDFPIIHLYNMPMKGFNENGFSDPLLVKEQLISGVKKIEALGADFVVLPCNTVHFFTKEMRKVIKIPLISILESTVEKIKRNNNKIVGILSSRSTRDLELYKKIIEVSGIKTITANEEDQNELDSIILKVMSGQQTEKEKEKIKKIIYSMKNLGAESIILGCTELPLAISQSDTTIPLYNTLNILAEDAVDFSYMN